MSNYREIIEQYAVNLQPYTMSIMALICENYPECDIPSYVKEVNKIQSYMPSNSYIKSRQILAVIAAQF